MQYRRLVRMNVLSQPAHTLSPGDRPVPARSPRAVTLAAGLLVLAALAAYWNTFSAPFVFDDVPGIIDNPSIRHLWPLSTVLQPLAIFGSAAGRPVVNLSLAINYAIGGTDVRGYHALNLVFHVLAALTLFGIVRRTLERFVGAQTCPFDKLRAPSLSRGCALFAEGDGKGAARLRPYG